MTIYRLHDQFRRGARRFDEWFTRAQMPLLSRMPWSLADEGHIQDQ
jgi:hypothetical protein